MKAPTTLAFAAAILGATALGAAAQTRCRVMDPTDTPLNVRTAPNGRIVGALPNGMLVTVLDRTSDRNGRPWVYVARFDTGRPIGWVYREFVACF